MKKLLAIITLCVAVLVAPALAQTAPAGITDTITSIWDVNNTNSLIHAGEVNVTTHFIWDAEANMSGAGIRADWWVTQQNGMEFGYYELSDRTGFWNLGYQTRTLFGAAEFSLGLGTLQDTRGDFGTVKLYVEPGVSYGVYASSKVNVRISGGCYIITGEKPKPWIGTTFRFARW